MTTTVSVVERGGWSTVDLTAGQAAAVAASGIVQLKRGTGAGRWQVRAKRLVGVARVGRGGDAVEVRIAPKTPIERLLFLVGYARNQQGWQDVEVDARAAADLVPAAAHAFARAAERALREGLLLGYREVEEASQIVRGRIREAEQIRHRYGLPVPVEVRFDDHTADIPENQLLRAAAERLLGLPGLMPTSRQMLVRLLPRLAEAARLSPRCPPPAWRPTRLNARYHTALGLADLVLRGASYELDDGTSVRVDGLLLDMWRVFEDFVTLALTAALSPYGRCRCQPKGHRLDTDDEITLRPDLVRYVPADSGEWVPAAVVDAKYIIDTGVHGHNDALYQMLAYCTALGLACGHLVYVRDTVPRRSHAVRRSGVTIVEHYLDLTVPVAGLRSQIDQLATDIANT